MESPFVALQCKVCGGKLDVPEPNVVEGVDGVYSIIGNSTFTCQFCDTEYLPRQGLKRFAEGGQVVISGVDGGSVVISNIITGYVGGDIIAGDKIDGDKIVVVSEQTQRKE
jgi:transcription elongation factor Elf1